MDENLNQNCKNDNVKKSLDEYEEYYLIKGNNAHKIIIKKLENEIQIKCKDYYIQLNNNDLSILTNSLLNSIDEAYEFIINIFERNKVTIKNIIFKKMITLSLKINIHNLEKDIEIILVYQKKNKKLKNQLINGFNKINENLSDLEGEINIIRKEINHFTNNNIKISQNNEILNKIAYNNIGLKLHPQNIKFSHDLAKDSYANYVLDNTFSVFISINNILYLTYSNENKSIIFYNIIDNKEIKEIKNAHDRYITNFRHYLDEINKRDLILSISSDDNNIKLWNVNNFECLLDIKNIYNESYLNSACFLNDNNNIYIISSNCTYYIENEPIKVFNLNGEKIKEINNSNDNTSFIDTYYCSKLNNIFIIAGNRGNIKSYDYNKNEIYHTYFDNDKNEHRSIIINSSEEIIKLIEASLDQNIRIWNFHTGELINKITINNFSFRCICLWNNDYLFFCDNSNEIELLDLKKGIVIKKLSGHNKSITCIKKIIHPIIGECLISQSFENGEIKLWTNN